jgi:hypothetical protein
VGYSTHDRAFFLSGSKGALQLGHISCSALQHGAGSVRGLSRSPDELLQHRMRSWV